jgi:hypothetical protein
MKQPSIQYQIAQLIYVIIAIAGFIKGILIARNIFPSWNFDVIHLIIYSLLLGCIIYLFFELFTVIIVWLFNNSLLYKILITFILSINRKKSLYYYLHRSTTTSIATNRRYWIQYDVPSYEKRLNHYNYDSTEKNRKIFIKNTIYFIIWLLLIISVYTYRIFN